jgi:hypothetical protein
MADLLSYERLWWGGGLAIFMLLVLAVVAASTRLPFTSDDVAVQNIMQSAWQYGRLDAVIGIDSFAIKVPLYAMVGLLLPNGHAALVVTVILCDAILLAGLLFAVREVIERVAPRDRVVLVATMLLMLWFFAAQFTQNQSLMIPNGRNAEIGLVIAASAVLLRGSDESDARSPSRLGLSVMASVVIALVCFSDPLFLFVAMPAFLGAVLVLWLRRSISSPRLIRVVVHVGAAGAVAVLFLLAARFLGIHYVGNFSTTFTAPGDLAANVGRAFAALAVDFNADVWGGAVSASALPGVSQLTLFLLCAVLVAVGARRAARISVALFALVAVIVNVAVFILTTNGSLPSNSRYVLFAAVLLLLLAPVGLVSLRSYLGSRRVLGLVSVVALAGTGIGLGANSLTLVQGWSGALADPQIGTTEIIDRATELGLEQGYSDYWNGNITTYLSGREVKVLPMVCDDKVSRYDWFINLPDFDNSPERQFFVVSDTRGCSEKDVVSQFGAPDKRIDLAESDASMLVYDRTIVVPSR